MSYLKSVEIISLLIALFIAIAPDKIVICIPVVFKNQQAKRAFSMLVVFYGIKFRSC